MSNRFYRLFFGAILLFSLYFEVDVLLYALIGLAAFEGLSNLRIPRLASRLRHGDDGDPGEGCLGIQFRERTSFEAERAWRLLVTLVLAFALFGYPDQLWFLPWFMGFAILGAGMSGVCPMFLLLKSAGLR
jgi:hypothetical protein